MAKTDKTETLRMVCKKTCMLMSFTAELFFKLYTLKQNAVIIYSAVLVNDTELLIGAAAAELLLHSRLRLPAKSVSIHDTGLWTRTEVSSGQRERWWDRDSNHQPFWSSDRGSSIFSTCSTSQVLYVHLSKPTFHSSVLVSSHSLASYGYKV